MLKVAIETAIKKSPHYDLAGNLFNVDHGICKHQFVGFVSSYTRFNVLTLFHLHSFVTFYMDLDSNTVVTCSLTTRHHILSNMQDCLMQLLQLMQFWKTESFAVSLTNKGIGSDVKINRDSIDGYVGLDFDMSTFNEDGSGDVYVGYHTHKITLPVISLTVLVMLPIPVMFFLRGTLLAQVLQKQDHHTRKRTLPV
jgi:hypothetical protein